MFFFFFFFNDTATTEIYTLSLHDALPIWYTDAAANPSKFPAGLFSICTGSYALKHAFAEVDGVYTNKPPGGIAYRCSRSEEHTSELQSQSNLVCRLLLEKKKKQYK